MSASGREVTHRFRDQKEHIFYANAHATENGFYVTSALAIGGKLSQFWMLLGISSGASEQSSLTDVDGGIVEQFT